MCTVKELIEKLEQLPEDMEVFIADDYSSIDYPSLCLDYPDHFDVTEKKLFLGSY